MGRRTSGLGILLLCVACNSRELGEGSGCEDRTSAFASSVLAYDPTVAGGPVPGHPNFSDPDAALGPPDYAGGAEGSGSVALSLAGVLDVGFEECAGVSTGDEDPELIVHEVGPKHESFYLAISTPDSVATENVPELEGRFYVVGLVDEQEQEVDVDGVLGTQSPIRIDAVRIIDDPADGTHGSIAPGADIDAIELFWPVAP